jgi:hypothetical protein
MAPKAEIHFQRIAVNSEQIEQWGLPTRPTKTSDSRAKGFGAVSVELDAIEPGRFQRIVESAIERHMTRRQLEVLKAAEESERDLLRNMVENMGGRS